MSWGSLDIPSGEGRRIRLGSLQLDIFRHGPELRLDRTYDADPLAANTGVEPLLEPPQAGIRLAAPEGPIVLAPRLPDQNVVARAQAPMHLPADSRVTVHVSVPLWVDLGGLAEFGVTVPPETWFGPNTVEGELCYASRTRMRVEAEDLMELPHRALVEITLENLADELLKVERLLLPIKRLPLLRGPTGFATPPLRFTRREVGLPADVDIGRGEGEVVAEAREPASESSLGVFTALIMGGV